MVYRRGQRLRPINSSKKEIVWSNLSQNASSVVNVLLADSKIMSTVNLDNEVSTGTKIMGCYLEFQFSAETITNTKIIHWTFKKTFNQTVPSKVPSLYFQIDRSKTLQRGMEMLPKSVNTIIKRIIYVRIPKGMQQMADGERLYFSYIASSTETINACGFAIYKAYT